MNPDRLRRKLLKAIGIASLALSGGARAAGSLPMAAGITGLAGRVTVNGKPVRVGQLISRGDLVETGPGSHVVLVVEKDAFLLRENTRIAFDPEDITLRLQVLAGKILSVMAQGRTRKVRTPSASLGIRGTGFYIEVEPERTYLCTCYGTVELGPANHAMRETVTTAHHESPRYIYDRADNAIVKAPVINHTDDELIMLESLVGRRPPFTPGEYY